MLAAVIQRWLRSPAWVRYVTIGFVITVVQLILRLLLDAGSFGDAVVLSLITGVLYGAVVCPLLVRQQRRFDSVLEEVPEGQRRDVQRAARRGPAPQDLQVRVLAARVVEHRLRTAGSQHRSAALIFSLFAVGGAWVAVTGRGWGWWLAVALFLGLLVVALLQPRRLRRRLRLLGDPQGDPPGSAAAKCNNGAAIQ